MEDEVRGAEMSCLACLLIPSAHLATLCYLLQVKLTEFYRVLPSFTEFFFIVVDSMGFL